MRYILNVVFLQTRFRTLFVPLLVFRAVKIKFKFTVTARCSIYVVRKTSENSLQKHSNEAQQARFILFYLSSVVLRCLREYCTLANVYILVIVVCMWFTLACDRITQKYNIMTHCIIIPEPNNRLNLAGLCNELRRLLRQNNCYI